MIGKGAGRGFGSHTSDQDARRDVRSCEKSDIHLTLVMIDIDLDVRVRKISNPEGKLSLCTQKGSQVGRSFILVSSDSHRN